MLYLHLKPFIKWNVKQTHQRKQEEKEKFRMEDIGLKMCKLAQWLNIPNKEDWLTWEYENEKEWKEIKRKIMRKIFYSKTKKTN